MTLGRKIILRNVALVLGVGMLAASSLWGLLALRAQVAIIGGETTELNHLLNIGDEMTRAEAALVAGQTSRARDQLQGAVQDAQAYGVQDAGRLTEMRKDEPVYYDWDKHVRENIAYNAIIIEGQIPDTTGPDASHPPNPETIKLLDGAIMRIQRAVHDCQEFMAQQQRSADRILQIGLILVGGVSALILSCAVLLSQWHYQSVMRPLERLRQWVRRVGGAGDFPPPMEISGDLEFCELTVDVNQMAKELHDFYRELDQKVQQTSRELVRSQRLASVGFLAAGVAHEINNPLNIISGYAELTMKRLESIGAVIDEEAAGHTKNNLRIIREEAFRCKDITEKLLS